MSHTYVKPLVVPRFPDLLATGILANLVISCGCGMVLTLGNLIVTIFGRNIALLEECLAGMDRGG